MHTLRRCDAIWKKVVNLGKAGPKDAGNAHATRFVRGQKDAALCQWSTICRLCCLAPFVNALDFAVKQWTFFFMCCDDDDENDDGKQTSNE